MISFIRIVNVLYDFYKKFKKYSKMYCNEKEKHFFKNNLHFILCHFKLLPICKHRCLYLLSRAAASNPLLKKENPSLTPSINDLDFYSLTCLITSHLYFVWFSTVFIIHWVPLNQLFTLSTIILSSWYMSLPTTLHIYIYI